MTKTEIQIAQKTAVQQMLSSNDRAVDRALVAIFKRQTEAEKAAESTQVNNNVGFTGADAPFLTSLAKSAIRYGSLTDKQRIYARKRVAKYWRQLVDIAQANGRDVLYVGIQGLRNDNHV